MAQNYTIQRKVGTVSELLPVFCGNATTGAGLANVIASTVGFAWYRNDMAAISTGTCTTGTLGTYTVSSWVQANSTGMLGWYNFGLPDGVFASGRSAAVRLSSALMPEINIFIEVARTDNQTFMSSQTLSTNALVNINQILGSTPVTSASGIFSTNVTTILGSNAVTSAAGTLKTDIATIFGSAPVTTAAGVLAVAWDLSRTANLTSTVALTGTTISTNALVNMNQILGSAPVTTAAGVQAVAWDLSRTANLTSTIALTGTSISSNALVNMVQVLGSTPVTSAAGTLKADLASIYGTPPVTTAAGVQAVAWDLGRTANLTSTIALTGTSISSNILVALNQIFGSAPVTTGPGILSAGITGTQTYNITGNLSGSVGSVTGTVASVTGLNAALLDASVSSRLAAATYTAPLSAAGVRSAVGLASANLDTQFGTVATTTQAAAIQAKTDSLTFTTTGMVDTNLRAIRNIALTGDGSATPFGVT